MELAAAPPRPELIQQLRARLSRLDPGLRFVAQDLLGADAPIDLVALESPGRVVLLLVGGQGEDLELVGHALAQKAWVEARLADWVQLAPELGIRPEAGARVVLLCPAFRPETLAAVRAVPDGPTLATYRCIQNGAGGEVLVEPQGDAWASPSPPGAEPPPPVAFRSGLSEADLGLTPEERAEFRSE